jgi:hypothetical protein
LRLDHIGNRFMEAHVRRSLYLSLGGASQTHLLTLGRIHERVARSVQCIIIVEIDKALTKTRKKWNESNNKSDDDDHVCSWIVGNP